jgi:hypothetical protein
VTTRNIRFAQLSPSNALPFANYDNTTPGTLHTDVESVPFPNGGVISNFVDFFTVSTGADPDIWFYTSDPANDVAGGSVFSTRVFNGTADEPTWATSFITNYSVSDVLGNPAFSSGFNGVLRNTAAFVP